MSVRDGTPAVRVVPPHGRPPTHPVPSRPRKRASRTVRLPAPRRVLRILGGWGFLAVLLAGWQVAGSRDTTGLLPPFSAVATEMASIVTGPQLNADLLPSVTRALLGFVLGAVVGIGLGVAIGWWRGLDPWLRPSLEFLRAVPPPALVPIAVVTFGAGDLLRVVVIAVGTCWPVLLSSVDGLLRVDPGYIDSARVYTSGRSLPILRRVALPAALPQIVTGMRIGLAVSLIMMVVSEMIASSSGLGFLILQSQRLYAMTPMYAGTLLLALTGWLLTLLFSAAERRALVWFEGMKGRDHA